MAAGFAAGRSLVPADELPKPDPMLLRILHDATAADATHTTRLQGRPPRIKRPISESRGETGVVIIKAQGVVYLARRNLGRRSTL